MGCISNNAIENGQQCDILQEAFRKIECSICYGEFDHYKRTPMCLPCFHTICLRCVKHLNKK